MHLNGFSCTGTVGLFPSTLKILYLGWLKDPVGTYNKLSGSLVLNTQSLTQLGINYNLFTDLIISNTSALTSCDISYNPLLGNPHIANLTMCTQTGLYYPSLLPKTMLKTMGQSSFLPISTKLQRKKATAIPNLTSENSQESMYTFFSYSVSWTNSTNFHSGMSSIRPNFSLVNLSLFSLIQMVFRLFINVLILGLVLIKTPTEKSRRIQVKERNTFSNSAVEY